VLNKIVSLHINKINTTNCTSIYFNNPTCFSYNL